MMRPCMAGLTALALAMSAGACSVISKKAGLGGKSAPGTAAAAPSAASKPAPGPVAAPKTSDTAGLSEEGKRWLFNFKAYMNDCAPQERPAKLVNSLDALVDCEQLMPKQRDRLAKVPAEDHGHAMYQEYVAYQDELEKVVATWRTDYEAAKEAKHAAGDLAEVLKKDLGAISAALWFMADVKKGEDRLRDRDVSPPDIAKWEDLLLRVAQVAADCQGKYAPVLEDRDLRYRAKGDRMPDPRESCELAAKHKEILGPWLLSAASAWADSRAGWYQKFLDELKQDGITDDTRRELFEPAKISEDIAHTHAVYSKVAAVLAVDVPKATFAGWASFGDEFPKVFAQATKVQRERGKHTVGSIKGAVATWVRGAGMQLRTVGARRKVAKIEKNGLGVPTVKHWTVDALVQAKGERFCRTMILEVHQQYAGGGRYEKPVAKRFGSLYRVGTCR